MTRTFALMLLLACATPALAQAPQPPVLFGRKDFEMEWKVEPLRVVLSARYLAARGLMRLEVLDGQGRAVLRTLPTGDATLLVRQGQGGAYRFKVAPLGAFRPQASGEIQEIGGEKCREFTAGAGTLCLTDDGIPLVMRFAGGTLTASRLLRQPQHPGLFELPKGVEAKPLPSSIPAPVMPF